NIPKSPTGNYIAGKSDVLAILIAFKYFCIKSRFSYVKKKFRKMHQKLEASIPTAILAHIDKEMGITIERMGVL
ncbi:MAG: hypothetical protein IIZ54_05385, partial [Selenomonadaceae bacterium]|nr:hypothetical protein [Selenomonadaceae bacterium]